MTRDPWAETPRPGQVWRNLPDKERIAAAAECLTEHGWSGIVSVVSASPTGTVTVQFNGEIAAAERGKSARAMERELWDLDKGITVSCVAMMDKNALRRRLRGVEVL